MRVIRVLADAKRVSIDGEAYTVDMQMPANLSTLSWDVETQAKTRGYRTVKTGGDSAGFDDEAVMAPYVHAWRVAKDAAARKAEADKKAQEDAKAEADKAAADKLAERERQAALAKPLNDALGVLFATDHEVIKAVEAELAARGALPADLVAMRQQARAVVKTERAKS